MGLGRGKVFPASSVVHVGGRGLLSYRQRAFGSGLRHEISHFQTSMEYDLQVLQEILAIAQLCSPERLKVWAYYTQVRHGE